MISVDEARAIICGAIKPTTGERAHLEIAFGRTCAEPVTALLTQPPFRASAMDGYAVRLDDVRVQGARLTVIGLSSAGERFEGVIRNGAAVRIYTGAPVPEGADHVIIQENVSRKEDVITIDVPQMKPKNIRPAGIDFRRGDELIPEGARFTGPGLALAAAGGNKNVVTRRRPRVAVIGNGDELVMPGDILGPDQIVCSIPFGLAPMIDSWGGTAEFLGVAADDPVAIRDMIARALDHDLIIPIGGASVGDRDYMRSAFADLGFRLAFEKVAVRPGKPTWFGELGAARVLGLPGNPASALVTAILFIKPAIAAFLGRADREAANLTAQLAAPLPQNGPRESYLRAKLGRNETGAQTVQPRDNQDSSLLSVFAGADALIRRLPDAASARAGSPVECVTF